jgi:hypothetical protein
VRLALRVDELLLASWKAERETIARALPPALTPAPANGEHLVSLVALRFGGGHAGAAPVPPFSQLNVRTYVEFEGERAVFFLRSYVTLAALGGVAFGAPFRPARLHLRQGHFEAPAAGVSLPYRVTGPSDPGELGHHELGLFLSRGLRAFRVERGPAAWSRAEATGPVRADVLLALGFELEGEPSLFHSDEATFETDLPPRQVRAR